jgi:hypothetical protein
MFKLIRKILFRFVLVLLILVVVLLLTVNLPFDFYRHEASGTDYSDWMGENLQATQKVIDIAMLGAHDAFTSQISYASQTDLLSASSIQTGFTGALIRGFSVKQSKTQVSSVAGLLAAGVRYFDIRLTYNEKAAAWYTSHTYFSDDFETVLSSIAEFLAAHPGEFLILDIQHVNGIDYALPAENDPAFTEIRDLFAATGVLGYAYEEGTKILSDVTYGDMTANETQAGVLIFTKLQNEDDAFWSYGGAIRSAWANTDSEATAYEFLTAEAALIGSGEALTGNQMSNNPEATDAREGLRVMQGVLTMQMSGEGILGALLDWSLLTKARDFNSSLIDQTEFSDWLAAMPIFMVDYSDTNYENFNDRIMEIILESNGNS